MTFDNPGSLWWLTLAVPIVLVHFYRGRLRPVRVPSLLFWDQVVVEEERSSAIKRLRHYISLVLNLIALLLFVSILSGPRVPGWTKEAGRVAFLLDTSLSMAAGDRWAEAVGHVEQSLPSLRRIDEVALYDSSGVLVPFTTDRAMVLRALKQRPRWTRHPGDVAGTIREAHPDARIVELTDWKELKNAALTDARLRGDVARLRLEGFGIDGKTSLSVEADGKSVEKKAADIPGLTDVDLPGGELVRMSIPEDAFPIDDAAYFVVPDRSPPPVIVVSQGDSDSFLLTALNLLRESGLVKSVGTVRISQFAEIRDRISETTLVITSGGDLGKLGRGVYVCFGSTSDEWSFGEAKKDLRIVDWDRRHPALESVDPYGTAIRESRIVEGGTPMLRSDAGAIATAGGGPGRVWISLGFQIGDADIMLRPSSALFFYNLARWARSGAARTFPREVPCGGTLENRLPLIPARGAATIEWTDGRRVHRESVPYRQGILRHTLVLPGFYRVQLGSRTEWVAVPHAPVEESDVRKASEPPAVPAPLRWYQDLPWVLVAGLMLGVLMMMEWLLYQKGWI